MHRHLVLLGALATAALTVAACASTTSGTGTGPTLAPTTASLPASTPATSPLAPSTSPLAPSTSPVATLAPTSAPPTLMPTRSTQSGCPTKAKYCDQFADANSGWQVTNESHFFAQYDTYGGGTYRLGERRQATVTEDAPTNITRVSRDYSVLIDVDATPYRTMPFSASAGIDCWEHQTGGHTSAFLFFVNPTTVEIGLWDETTGAYHKIASKSAAGLVKTEFTANHLTVACLQASRGGGVIAELGIEINGKVALVAQYAKSTKNYAWDVAPNVGLIASGKGADVFYDNFAITSLCKGDYC